MANKHAKGILKALGQKKSTGHFKEIEKAKGKGAAIGALQNKLAKRRGEPIPFTGKHHAAMAKHHEAVAAHHESMAKMHAKLGGKPGALIEMAKAKSGKSYL